MYHIHRSLLVSNKGKLREGLFHPKLIGKCSADGNWSERLISSRGGAAYSVVFVHLIDERHVVNDRANQVVSELGGTYLDLRGPVLFCKHGGDIDCRFHSERG